MKHVAIIQARFASTRLPGKAMLDLRGKPVLAHVAERVRQAQCFDEVVVATMSTPDCDPISDWCRQNTGKVSCYRYKGAEWDVLGRYHAAARWAKAEIVTRITSDCPLTDPQLVRDVVRRGEPWSKHDFASNMVTPSYPQGFAVECMPVDTLERVHRMATDAQDREHVCTYVYKTAPNLFKVASVVDECTNSDVNLSVDTQKDLDRVRGVLAAYEQPTWRDALFWARLFWAQEPFKAPAETCKPEIQVSEGNRE